MVALHFQRRLNEEWQPLNSFMASLKGIENWQKLETRDLNEAPQIGRFDNTTRGKWLHAWHVHGLYP